MPLTKLEKNRKSKSLRFKFFESVPNWNFSKLAFPQTGTSVNWNFPRLAFFAIFGATIFGVLRILVFPVHLDISERNYLELTKLSLNCKTGLKLLTLLEVLG